jgi:integration host factor subunit beta
MIPEKRVPHFKPGKALREQVDAKTDEILGREPKKPS